MGTVARVFQFRHWERRRRRHRDRDRHRIVDEFDCGLLRRFRACRCIRRGGAASGPGEWRCRRCRRAAAAGSTSVSTGNADGSSRAIAIGGLGGSATNGNGGAGGTAVTRPRSIRHQAGALPPLMRSRSAVAAAMASVPGIRGAGGLVSDTVAEAKGNSASASTKQTGGAGGNGFGGANGGAGASSTLTNLLLGSTKGWHAHVHPDGGRRRRRRRCRGGRRPRLRGSIKSHDNDKCERGSRKQLLGLHALAYGGHGGYGLDGSSGAAGGAASATVDATSSTGTRGLASANGGYGGGGGAGGALVGNGGV